MARLLIVGASSFAKCVIDIVKKVDIYKELFIVDDFAELGSAIMGVEIIGTTSDVEAIRLKYSVEDYVIAVGANLDRVKIQKKIFKQSPMLNAAIIIDPRAYVSDNAVIKAGSIVMAGAFIGPCCNIGNYSIVNTNTTIAADCAIGDFVNMSPGVNCGSCTSIGNFTFVGIGTNIIQCLTIGMSVIIGAGSLVLDDVSDKAVAYGVPAKNEAKCKVLRYHA
jgi:sugar O-acyltransferase (sialic acid O-acetyltransferase NeuD family)